MPHASSFSIQRGESPQILSPSCAKSRGRARRAPLGACANFRAASIAAIRPYPLPWYSGRGLGWGLVDRQTGPPPQSSPRVRGEEAGGGKEVPSWIFAHAAPPGCLSLIVGIEFVSLTTLVLLNQKHQILRSDAQRTRADRLDLPVWGCNSFSLPEDAISGCCRRCCRRRRSRTRRRLRRWR